MASTGVTTVASRNFFIEYIVPSTELRLTYPQFCRLPMRYSSYGN
ncbi:uncharacterized protein METZ01_LOCUS322689 [marine metagenome]|uniref:Uncharacterized protein n=1 Tax=marine metagenome TaxID=408172 RepID=A0A382PB46_9ZZZZ